MNGQAADKNGEIKIDSGEAGQAKRNAEKVKFFHGEIIGGCAGLSRGLYSRVALSTRL
jgi:hypothetical protein